jgi:hypothetical protein
MIIRPFGTCRIDLAKDFVLRIQCLVDLCVVGSFSDRPLGQGRAATPCSAAVSFVTPRPRGAISRRRSMNRSILIRFWIVA